MFTAHVKMLSNVVCVLNLLMVYNAEQSTQ
jgi:hypothetical protein